MAIESFRASKVGFERPVARLRSLGGARLNGVVAAVMATVRKGNGIGVNNPVWERN
jgi:hypothetical protein